MPDIFTDETFAIETSVKTTHPLWVSVTGLAQGRTIKVAPKTFIVIPSHLEDYAVGTCSGASRTRATYLDRPAHYQSRGSRMRLCRMGATGIRKKMGITRRLRHAYCVRYAHDDRQSKPHFPYGS